MSSRSDILETFDNIYNKIENELLELDNLKSSEYFTDDVTEIYFNMFCNLPFEKFEKLYNILKEKEELKEEFDFKKQIEKLKIKSNDIKLMSEGIQREIDFLKVDIKNFNYQKEKDISDFLNN